MPGTEPCLPTAAPRGRPPLLGSISQPGRQRRDHMPNWSQQEVCALISAKRELYMEEIDMLDGRDLMTTDVNRWLHVSTLVMDAGFSPCLRDGPSCKTKWHQILPDYKRIADYHSRMGTNTPDYWEQAPVERLAGGLPRSFSQETFNQLHEWNGRRPHITPPHVRDLLAPNDRNYQANDEDPHDSATEDVDDSVPTSEERSPSLGFGSQRTQPGSPELRGPPVTLHLHHAALLLWEYIVPAIFHLHKSQQQLTEPLLQHPTSFLLQRRLAMYPHGKQAVLG
jgi:hypothetical protein